MGAFLVKFNSQDPYLISIELKNANFNSQILIIRKTIWFRTTSIMNFMWFLEQIYFIVLLIMYNKIK